jgi:hypothetical protein
MFLCLKEGWERNELALWRGIATSDAGHSRWGGDFGEPPQHVWQAARRTLPITTKNRLCSLLPVTEDRTIRTDQCRRSTTRPELWSIPMGILAKPVATDNLTGKKLSRGPRRDLSRR